MAMVSQPLSISGFADLTGKSRRAIGKALAGIAPVDKRGNASLYPTREALAAIYGDAVNELAVETTRLKKWQADKTEREVGRLDGDLLPEDEVGREWGSMVMAAKAKLRALPNKIAVRVAGLEVAEIETAASELVREALTELVVDEVCEAGGASSEDDGPVGAAA